MNAADSCGKNDVQESFVFAEVTKYVYLTQLEEVRFPQLKNDAGFVKITDRDHLG